MASLHGGNKSMASLAGKSFYALCSMLLRGACKSATPVCSRYVVISQYFFKKYGGTIFTILPILSMACD